MKVRATITQTLVIELPDDTDFEAYRREAPGNLSMRYDDSEVYCSGTPEQILITMLEDVIGGELSYTSSEIDVTREVA